jgi:hypothetical protein
LAECATTPIFRCSVRCIELGNKRHSRAACCLMHARSRDSNDTRAATFCRSELLLHAAMALKRDARRTIITSSRVCVVAPQAFSPMSRCAQG